MSYVLSQEAEGDLVDIYDRSFDDWGEVQASKYLDGIYATLLSLSRRPLSGRARPEIGQDIRGRLYGSHIIFYMARSGGIDVVRILHQARDIHSVFDGPHP